MSVATAPRPPRNPDFSNPTDVARWTRDLQEFLNRVYSDIAQAAIDVAEKQELDPTLAALAGLSASPGVVEQTGADMFTKRAIGVDDEDSLLTRDDADRRYAFLADFDNVLAKSAHSALAGETLTGYVTITDAAGVTRKLGVVS